MLINIDIATNLDIFVILVAETGLKKARKASQFSKR